MFLVATVPVLVALGLVRAVALLRRGTGASWRDALGAFFIWQSTSLVVARASVLGLFAQKAAFLRTPKTSEQAKWWEALRANWAETVLALLGAAGIAAALTRPAAVRSAAGRRCWYSRPWAWRPRRSTAGPPSGPRCRPTLRARRTSEYRRDRRSFAAGAAAGGLVTVAAVVVAAIALLLAPSHHFSGPSVVGPAQGGGSSGHTHAPGHAKKTPSSSPSATPSSSSPATPSPTPTPTSSTPSPTPTPTPTPTGSASTPGRPQFVAERVGVTPRGTSGTAEARRAGPRRHRGSRR